MRNQINRLYLVFGDETLMLDRKEGSLEYAKRRDKKNFFYHLYQDQAGVEELLDLEIAWQAGAEQEAQLTLRFDDESEINVGALPKEWPVFAKKIQAFMNAQNDGLLLDKTR